MSLDELLKLIAFWFLLGKFKIGIIEELFGFISSALLELEFAEIFVLLFDLIKSVIFVALFRPELRIYKYTYLLNSLLKPIKV